MKKRLFLYFFLLIASLTACAKRTVPVFADADTLARSLYDQAGFSGDSLLTEPLESGDAFRFGMTITDFQNAVEDGISIRNMVDADGQTLYALKLHTEEDAERFAASLFEYYDFAPCDPAEKMAVAAAGNYVIFFKSESSQVDAAMEAFSVLMEGQLRFEKEMFNRA